MAKIFDAVLKLSSQPFVKGLERAERSMEKFQKTSKDMSKNFKDVGKGFTAAGSTLTKAITLPAVAAGTMAVKAYADFEDALAGVKKTVDATPEQFKKITTGLEDMSKQIPVSATDLAGIAEAAGQLGIETDNILGFTRTVADLSVATNLGEEGAAQMAKFANITNMSQKDFDRLGSTIVDLGNNFATTEADIMAMSMRLGATGHQVGMSQAEILGLATSLSSVGIEAEAGGSAMSKLLMNMASAADVGGKELTNFAKATGMTEQAFRDLFKSDPSQALQVFIKSLGDAEKQGKSAIQVLDEMGIKDIRMRNTLLSAANASDLFADANSRANNAWRENTALAKEAETKYATLKSTFTILKNRVFLLGKTFGGYLVPYVKLAADKIGQLTDYFESMSDKSKKRIVDLVVKLALLGPALLGIGKVLTIFKTGFGAFSNLSGMVKDAGGIMQLILSPAGKVVLVLVAIGIAIALMIKHWDKVKGVLSTVAEVMAPIAESIRELFAAIGTFISEVIWPAIQGILEDLKGLWEAIWPYLSTVLQEAFGIISAVVQTVIGVFTGLITFLTGVFTGNWQMAWEGVKKIFSSIWEGIKGVAFSVLNGIIDRINLAIGMINKIKVPDWVPGLGGKGVNIATIPHVGQNAMGTSSWIGGPTQVHEKGPEIIDLPRGTRILPHDKSIQEAYRSGKARTDTTTSTSFVIPKLADTIVVREDADIDRIANALYKKLSLAKHNKVGVVG